MTSLLKKLNFKNQKVIYILNHPEDFENELKEMEKFASIKTDLHKSNEIEFVLTFVYNKKDIDKFAIEIDKKLKGDGIVWFAYIKKSSQKYKEGINRDYGWDIFEELQYESVRAVSINDDWSTIRFRRNQFVKVLKRK